VGVLVLEGQAPSLSGVIFTAEPGTGVLTLTGLAPTVFVMGNGGDDGTWVSPDSPRSWTSPGDEQQWNGRSASTWRAG
jgi:hypothetical protein